MRKTILSLFFLPIVVGVWISSCLANGELTVSLSRQAGELSYQSLNDTSILAAVLDTKGDAILGLTKDDFVIKKGSQIAQILSVQDQAESRDTGLNLVFVVDNSYSMELRKAVDPLLDAMQSFFALVRPIDTVHVVVFANPKDTGDPATSNGSVKVFKSNNGAELSGFLRKSFYPDTTDGTYLYDAMVTGLGIIKQMPSEKQKFMIVFSDGEDINSHANAKEVETSAQNLTNFSAYAIDYMDKPEVDYFLKSFAGANHGEIRKARSASDFLSILKNFSSAIFHRYVVNYRFYNSPEGTISIAPAMLTVEELTIVDSSPMLNYIYFGAGESNIPGRYVSLKRPDGTRTFDEEKLQGTMEKYQNVLNIIGKRMVNHPSSRLTLVGCASDTGVEKGNVTLSRNRATAVASYLSDTWGIDPGRMMIKAQKLPAVPSTTRVPEGVAENQRVEITSNDMAILAPAKSTYVEEQVDIKEVRVQLSINAEAGIKNYQLTLLGDGNLLKKVENQGEPPASITFSLDSIGPRTLASLGQITARLDVTDKEEREFTTQTMTPIQIKYIKREERIAQKMGYRVMERYPLILFEFDRAEIKQQNQSIMDRIIARIKELPSSQTQISGHTDIIGSEQYNLDLSARRAKAAYDLIISAGIPAGTTVNFQGVGQHAPPYDNTLPEGRAYNRTVVTTVNYATEGM